MTQGKYGMGVCGVSLTWEVLHNDDVTCAKVLNRARYNNLHERETDRQIKQDYNVKVCETEANTER